MASYIELYKKHRPRTLDEVVGQSSITDSIRKSVLENKVPTGYLFSGGAGTGKTSIALILAKMLNCEQPDKETGNPCNACPICKGIDSNSIMGVKYISMANNGGAEDVRKLMEESRIAQPIKRKVYILDEVHNLSSAAQDAMLIGLEDEKQNTLFICCTTDPDKVKPAILSRLQQRTFRSLTVRELAEHLIKIIKSEPDLKSKLTKEQIIQCCQQAGGSVRNAINNLENVTTTGQLQKDFSIDILKALVNHDLLSVLQLMEENGDNAPHTVHIRTLEQVFQHFVNILKIKSGVPDNTSPFLDILSKIKGKLVLQAIYEIGETMKQISNKTVDYKILIELCYIKLTSILKEE